MECSSGTYVRSLGRDLAESLGTAAVMSSLVRTAIGGFQLESSCTLEQLVEQGLPAWLLPPARAVEGLPKLVLSQAEATEIGHGRALPRVVEGDESPWAAFSEQGDLVAVLARRADGALGPTINFPPQAE